MYHLAAQTAVTTSVADPRTTSRSTRRHLQRARSRPPRRRRPHRPLHLHQQGLRRHGGRRRRRADRRATTTATCRTASPRTSRSTSIRPTAAPRARPTSTCATTHRIYGLPTVVFRQSCIYGPRQFGVEDQGWVAWFMIAAADRQADHHLRRRQAGARHALRRRPGCDAYEPRSTDRASQHGRADLQHRRRACRTRCRSGVSSSPSSKMLRPIRSTGVRGPGGRGDQQVFVADTRKAERDLRLAAARFKSRRRHRRPRPLGRQRTCDLFADAD